MQRHRINNRIASVFRAYLPGRISWAVFHIIRCNTGVIRSSRMIHSAQCEHVTETNRALYMAAIDLLLELDAFEERLLDSRDRLGEEKYQSLLDAARQSTYLKIKRMEAAWEAARERAQQAGRVAADVPNDQRPADLAGSDSLVGRWLNEQEAAEAQEQAAAAQRSAEAAADAMAAELLLEDEREKEREKERAQAKQAKAKKKRGKAKKKSKASSSTSQASAAGENGAVSAACGPEVAAAETAAEAAAAAVHSCPQTSSSSSMLPSAALTRPPPPTDFVAGVLRRLVVYYRVLAVYLVAYHCRASTLRIASVLERRISMAYLGLCIRLVFASVSRFV